MIISFHIPETGRIRFQSVPVYKQKWSHLKTLNSIEMNEFEISSFPEKPLLWLEIEFEEKPIGFVKLQASNKPKHAELIWFLSEEFMWKGIEPKIIESMVDYCMTVPEILAFEFTTLDKIWKELFLVSNKKKQLIDADIYQFFVTIDHKKSAQEW